MAVAYIPYAVTSSDFLNSAGDAGKTFFQRELLLLLYENR